MERTNAMHATLPEPVRIVTVDVSWTRQKNILPAARRMLTAGGDVVTLIKPHYEAPKSLLRKGVLPEEAVPTVVEATTADAVAAGFEVVRTVRSPITGGHGNVEVLCWLRPHHP
jgi:23S rRNA (cytidine1920-2'-O)/16S rRNA (cytidine1409-2'-O)-methyltransferase